MSKLSLLLQALSHHIDPQNIYTDPADCWAYGYDYSRRHVCPAAVIFASSHAEVSELVRLCYQHHIPITARGRGTGTPGGAVPTAQGIVLSLEKMARIIDIDEKNRVARVEPGVINLQLQTALAELGFFWPPDPSSSHICTIGGNLAYNSAGPRAVKYGTPRENTLALQTVIGTGETLHAGVYTTKGVVGYDLTRLLIGSEGTLGIITTATLKLTPLPEAKYTLRACYRDIESAALAVAAIMRQPAIPCALEFLDDECVTLLKQHSNIPLPAGTNALLMIEIDGLQDALPAAVKHIKTAAKNQQLIDITVAQTEHEITELWRIRKALSPLLRDIAPKKISEDIVVPVSELATFIRFTQTLAEQHKIKIVNFGHAGNGNIHVNLLINPDNPTEMQAATLCLEQLFKQVIAMRGTLSGEHGIGLEKMSYLHLALDPINIQLMQKIKQQFDPAGILNPGKIFPTTGTL